MITIKQADNIRGTIKNLVNLLPNPADLDSGDPLKEAGIEETLNEAEHALLMLNADLRERVEEALQALLDATGGNDKARLNAANANGCAAVVLENTHLKRAGTKELDAFCEALKTYLED